MLGKYKLFFEFYLGMCKEKYDPEKPYDNLKECIKTCERCKEKLIGMLDLMEACGEIRIEERDAEFEKVIDEFSSLKICNAYMEDGEVMVFARRGGE